MQKGLVFVVLLVSLSFSVFAFSLSDITGWFVALFADPLPPEIDAFVSPVKVRPGDQLVITVSAKDDGGIETVIAEVSHENGNDTLQLVHTTGTKKQGTYQAAWKVHDTLDQKWYNITITATNKQGLASTVLVEYQDPTVSHVADQVRPGTFTSGRFVLDSTSRLDMQGSELNCTGCVNTTDVNSAQVQLRVSGTCSGSQGIQSVGSSGTVSCGTFSGVNGEVLVLHHPSGSGSVSCPSGYTTVMTGRSYIGYGNNNPGSDGDMTCVKTAFATAGSSDGSDITAGYISSSTTCKVCIRDDAPVGSVLELHMGDSTTFTSACSATGVTLPSSTTWSAQFSSAGKSYAGTGTGLTSGGTGGHLTCIAATYSTSVSSSGGSFGGGSSLDDAMFADSASGTTLTATNCNICIRTA